MWLLVVLVPKNMGQGGLDNNSFTGLKNQIGKYKAATTTTAGDG